MNQLTSLSPAGTRLLPARGLGMKRPLRVPSATRRGVSVPQGTMGACRLRNTRIASAMPLSSDPPAARTVRGAGIGARRQSRGACRGEGRASRGAAPAVCSAAGAAIPPPQDHHSIADALKVAMQPLRRVLAVVLACVAGLGFMAKASLANVVAVAPSHTPTGMATRAEVLQILAANAVPIAVLTLAAVFCSVCETSITTLWPWKVRELAASEPPGNPFELVRRDVSRYLTTILIISTFCNIAISAVVTDMAIKAFGEGSIAAVTILLTVFMLLFCEIMPKSAAVSNSVPLARFVVPPLSIFATILYPIGRCCTISSNFLLRLLGVTDPGEPFVSEDELKLVLSGAEAGGAIDKEESSMVENVLDLDETAVREVMTPLVDVVAIDKDSNLKTLRETWQTEQVSRVPVFEDRIDNIVGVAYSMEVVNYTEDPELLDNVLVSTIMQQPYIVPDSMTVWNLLREFRIRKVHMAIVVNEYGGVCGIVTMEDVVEEIVGEIYDETDSSEWIQGMGQIVKREEGIFDVDAKTELESLGDELTDEINADFGDAGDELGVETVGGYVVAKLGYIPEKGVAVTVYLRDLSEEAMNAEPAGEGEEGEELAGKEMLFTVTECDNRRVTRVRVEDPSVKREKISHSKIKATPVGGAVAGGSGGGAGAVVGALSIDGSDGVDVTYSFDDDDTDDDTAAGSQGKDAGGGGGKGR